MPSPSKAFEKGRALMFSTGPPGSPRPLCCPEQADYAKLSVRIVAVAQPKDLIEELLGRDVIDLGWESARLRRIKAGILKASMSDGVREVLDSSGRGEGQTTAT